MFIIWWGMHCLCQNLYEDLGAPPSAAALPPVSAAGLGLPRPYAAMSRYTAQNARHSTTSGGSGQHRAPARPPVRPGANTTIKISPDSYFRIVYNN